MTASKFIVIPILTCLLILIDWYVWQAVQIVFKGRDRRMQVIVKHGFWGAAAIILAGLWAYNFIDPDILGTGIRTVIAAGLFISYGAKLFSVVFILIDDISRLFDWVRSKVIPSREMAEIITDNGRGISRSDFLMKTALLAAAIPAGVLTWGVLSGAYDYRIRRVLLRIKDLPKAFEGMTIAQISDIHTGSFFNKTAVKGGVEMLMRERPEMVFFTGDLVNDRAGEVKDYINIFDKIKAPLGVYSTFGNHDYGVYTS